MRLRIRVHIVINVFHHVHHPLVGNDIGTWDSGKLRPHRVQLPLLADRLVAVDAAALVGEVIHRRVHGGLGDYYYDGFD